MTRNSVLLPAPFFGPIEADLVVVSQRDVGTVEQDLLAVALEGFCDL